MNPLMPSATDTIAREKAANISRFTSDRRYIDSDKDRADPTLYWYWEYCAGEADIVGRNGSHYSFQYHERREDGDLYDILARRFVCEDGVANIDDAIDILNEIYWREEYERDPIAAERRAAGEAA